MDRREVDGSRFHDPGPGPRRSAPSFLVPPFPGPPAIVGAARRRVRPRILTGRRALRQGEPNSGGGRCVPDRKCLCKARAFGLVPLGGPLSDLIGVGGGGDTARTRLPLIVRRCTCRAGATSRLAVDLGFDGGVAGVRSLLAVGVVVAVATADGVVAVCGGPGAVAAVEGVVAVESGDRSLPPIPLITLGRRRSR